MIIEMVFVGQCQDRCFLKWHSVSDYGLELWMGEQTEILMFVLLLNICLCDMKNWNDSLSLQEHAAVSFWLTCSLLPQTTADESKEFNTASHGL